MIRIERKERRKDGLDKIERKKNNRKAGARNEKKRYQRFGMAIRKPAQKEMKKIGQRIKQEQKRKSMGRSSLINFLKRKVLPITVKREETGSRKERISYKKRRDKRR